MYDNIKSCVSLTGQQYEIFQCVRGLRQGWNLSHILFSLYLNDLEHYLLNNGAPSLDLYNENLNLFVKFIILLYADDTVIFAKSKEHLINSLNIFMVIVKSGNSR